MTMVKKPVMSKKWVENGVDPKALYFGRISITSELSHPGTIFVFEDSLTDKYIYWKLFSNYTKFFLFINFKIK